LIPNWQKEFSPRPQRETETEKKMDSSKLHLRDLVSRFWLVAPSIVIIIAGLKAASSIIVILLLAVFITAIFSPLFLWLKKKGVPDFLSIITIIFIILVIDFLLAALIGASVAKFTSLLPQYQQRTHILFASYTSFLKDIGFDSKYLDLGQIFDPALLVDLAGKILSGFGNLVSNSLIIILIVIFFLLELTTFRRKIYILSKSKLTDVDAIYESLNRYFGIKTITSFLTGLFIAISLRILGVDFPYLWGVLAFLLNFIPNIGSIIAAIPAIIIATLELGFGAALETTVVFLIVNFAIGNIIEPRMMGKNLGLSTLVVFLSLLFWGWILGPVGMLLSVPLTMSLKIAADNSRSMKSLGLFLGNDAEIEEWENNHRETDN
jgi:predicted PurR-regulated permease PerM